MLQQKDRQGLSLLYDHYSPALLGLILRKIPDRTVAEEVLQDVFMKIWNNFERYDPNKGKLFTWMAQICNFTAIDRTRSSQFKKGRQSDSIDNYEYIKEGLSEQSYIPDSGLRKVLGKLDGKSQLIIDYLYFKGYSQSETSKQLDIPLGTVKTKVRAAIKQLRVILANEKMISIGFLFYYLIKILQ